MHFTPRVTGVPKDLYGMDLTAPIFRRYLCANCPLEKPSVRKSPHLFKIHEVWQPRDARQRLRHKSLRHNEFLEIAPNSHSLGYPTARALCSAMVVYQECAAAPRCRSQCPKVGWKMSTKRRMTANWKRCGVRCYLARRMVMKFGTSRRQLP